MRAELEAEAEAVGVGRLLRRLEDLDPVAAAKIEPGNVRRVVRALEVAAITGSPFSSFAADWERYDPSRVVGGGRSRSTPRSWPPASRIASRRCSQPAGSTRCGGSSERGFGAWLTSSQAIGYAELVRHLDGRLSLEEAWEGTVRRTKNLARRQMAWFRRDPRVHWFEAGAGGAIEVVDDVLGSLAP